MKLSDLFDGRVFRLGLKRTRALGLLTVILTVLASVAVPLVTLIVPLFVRGYDPGSSLVSSSQMMTPLLILLVAGPVMAVSSFSFLDRRHTCDFYHALPYRRLTFWAGLLEGIYTWLFGTAVVSFLLRLLLFTLCPGYTVAVGPSFLALLSLCIGVMQITALTALAMSLTGTRLSNLAVFVLLVGEVPWIISSLDACLTAVVPVISLSHSFLRYLTLGNYLPLALFSGILGTGTRFLNVPLMIWSFLLGVACLVLGGWAYAARPSECAGAPAQNYKWQHVFRLAAALPTFLGAVTFLLIALTPGEGRWFALIPVLPTLGSAFVVYLLYELFTSGKLRKFGRSALAFLWLFAVGAVFLVTSLCVRSAVLRRPLERSEIESVSFVCDDEYDFLEVLLGTNTYESLRQEELSFSDPEILDTVFAAYGDSLEACRTGHFSDASSLIGALVYSYDLEHTVTSLDIRLKSGRHLKRNLQMTSDDYETLMADCQSSAVFREAFLSLPDDKIVSTVSVAGISLSRAEAMRVWHMFCDRYAALTDTQKEAIKQNTWGLDDSSSIFSLTVRGEYHGKTYESVYPVSALFPDVISAVFTAANTREVDGSPAVRYVCETLATIEEKEHDEDYYFSANLELVDEDGDSVDWNYLFLDADQPLDTWDKPAAYARVRELLSAFDGTFTYEPGTTCFVAVEAGMGGVYATVYLPLCPEDFAEIRSLLDPGALYD